MKPKKKSKPPQPEYDRPTKEELLEIAEEYAQAAMRYELFSFLRLVPDISDYHAYMSREQYVLAEALERWADRIAAEEVAERWWTEFEAETEKVFGTNAGIYKQSTHGAGQWVDATGDSVSPILHVPVAAYR